MRIECATPPKEQSWLRCCATVIVLIVASSAIGCSLRQYRDDQRHIAPSADTSTSTGIRKKSSLRQQKPNPFDQYSIHPQCYRGKTSKLKNRPLLIFKYARSGSTWLARTGETLRLNNSDKNMYFVSEAEGCGDIYSEQLTQWFIEYMYFSGETKGNLINVKNKKQTARANGRKGLETKCIKPAIQAEKMGPVMIATIDWKNNVPYPDPDRYAMDLTSEQYSKLFDAVPNLSIGVLTRTNSVKRAVSLIAAEEQVRKCGSRKLKGKEDCIEDLSKRLHLNTTNLYKHIKDTEAKSMKMTSLAAELSAEYSNGKIFCITYESMQNDMASELEALGEFIGADIATASLEKLRQDPNKKSYKRGLDDLSTYIENYEEVRESLRSYPCLLRQLESKEKINFPPCYLNKKEKAGKAAATAGVDVEDTKAR